MSTLTDSIKAEIAAYLGSEMQFLMWASKAERSSKDLQNAAWHSISSHDIVLDTQLLQADGKMSPFKVASAINEWQNCACSSSLSPKLSASLSACTPQDLNCDSELEKLLDTLKVGRTSRVTRYKPFASSDEESEEWATEGKLVRAKDEIGEYGKVSQSMRSSMTIQGIHFRLRANCAVEVDTGSFACWEDGLLQVKMTAKWQTLFRWRGTSGDAADDDEDVEVFLAKKNVGTSLAARLGVGVTRKQLCKFIFKLLIQPFRLSVPPHDYAFADADCWKDHLEMTVLEKF
jgi:hypothetical protein